MPSKRLRRTNAAGSSAAANGFGQIAWPFPQALHWTGSSRRTPSACRDLKSAAHDQTWMSLRVPAVGLQMCRKVNIHPCLRVVHYSENSFDEWHDCHEVLQFLACQLERVAWDLGCSGRLADITTCHLVGGLKLVGVGYLPSLNFFQKLNSPSINHHKLSPSQVSFGNRTHLLQPYSKVNTWCAGCLKHTQSRRLHLAVVGQARECPLRFLSTQGQRLPHGLETNNMYVHHTLERLQKETAQSPIRMGAVFFDRYPSNGG